MGRRTPAGRPPPHTGAGPQPGAPHPPAPPRSPAPGGVSPTPPGLQKRPAARPAPTAPPRRPQVADLQSSRPKTHLRSREAPEPRRAAAARTDQPGRPEVHQPPEPRRLPVLSRTPEVAASRWPPRRPAPAPSGSGGLGKAAVPAVPLLALGVGSTRGDDGGGAENTGVCCDCLLDSRSRGRDAGR